MYSTFGSFPVTDIDAANDPSMEKTTVSVLGGTTARYMWSIVWSPRTSMRTGYTP